MATESLASLKKELAPASSIAMLQDYEPELVKQVKSKPCHVRSITLEPKLLKSVENYSNSFRQRNEGHEIEQLLKPNLSKEESLSRFITTNRDHFSSGLIEKQPDAIEDLRFTRRQLEIAGQKSLRLHAKLK